MASLGLRWGASKATSRSKSPVAGSRMASGWRASEAMVTTMPKRRGFEMRSLKASMSSLEAVAGQRLLWRRDGSDGGVESSPEIPDCILEGSWPAAREECRREVETKYFTSKAVNCLGAVVDVGCVGWTRHEAARGPETDVFGAPSK